MELINVISLVIITNVVSWFLGGKYVFKKMKEEFNKHHHYLLATIRNFSEELQKINNDAIQEELNDESNH